MPLQGANRAPVHALRQRKLRPRRKYLQLPFGLQTVACAPARQVDSSSTAHRIHAVETEEREDQPEGDVGSYHKTDRSYRQFCRSCGGHLMTLHSTFNLIDVYAATI